MLVLGSLGAQGPWVLVFGSSGAWVLGCLVYSLLNERIMLLQSRTSGSAVGHGTVNSVLNGSLVCLDPHDPNETQNQPGT